VFRRMFRVRMMWPEDSSVVVDDWFNLIGGEDTTPSRGAPCCCVQAAFR
jgi:hypothetical protein